MKNIFKFLGIAFIASAMMVACGEKNEVETYTITANANDATMGTVTGGGEYEVNSTITLTATANAGYVFVNWEDGSTNNPRIVTVTGDATYTANFEPESGVKVTFGSTTWDAQYINALYSASQGAFVIAACQGAASTSYPQIQLGLLENAAVGTFTGEPSIDFAASQASKGNPYVWYYTEADRCTVTLGGVTTGDWWDKTVTVNVTALDATSMTLSFVANATMGDFIYAINNGGDWAGTETRDLTIQVTNQPLTAAKGLLKACGVEQLARF